VRIYDVLMRPGLGTLNSQDTNGPLPKASTFFATHEHVVARLQVAMNKARVMGLVQRICNLNRVL
jgi:uncharacterized protein YigA (DUF484 family)